VNFFINFSHPVNEFDIGLDDIANFFNDFLLAIKGFIFHDLQEFFFGPFIFGTIEISLN
jgi:hypothetical protein